MAFLRRVLYLDALVKAVAGLTLIAVPRLVLVTLLGQPAYAHYGWVRLTGIHALSLSLLMVLVAHRIEDLWWWSWAFVVLMVGTATVLTLQAAVGLPPNTSSVMWWGAAGIGWGFTGGLLWGLGRAGMERPPN
jgi:hypothetical protein